MKIKQFENINLRNGLHASLIETKNKMNNEKSSTRIFAVDKTNPNLNNPQRAVVNQREGGPGCHQRMPNII